MIGVSTGQNISNLIPAVQFETELSGYCLLETTRAQQFNWSKGLTSVLHSRGVKVATLDLKGIDSNIPLIIQTIKEQVWDHTEPIMWNIGGGQKPQQIAVWEVFRARCDKGLSDSICYANQDDAGILEIWSYNDSGHLTLAKQEIYVDISVEEIFTVSGFQLREEPNIIYKRGEIIDYDLSTDLLTFPEFREYMLRLPAKNSRNNRIDTAKRTIPVHSPQLKAQIHRNSIQLNASLLRSCMKFENLKPGPGYYFEKIVIDRIWKLLNSQKHNINVAYANLITERGGNIAAEYDLLCVTTKGTVRALDAKTFDFKYKDIDARLYNLEQGSGYYRSFSAVFPFDVEDLSKTYFPDQLRHLPSRLMKRNLDFYVVNDSSNDRTVYIQPDGSGGILTSYAPFPSGISVPCKPLSDFINP
ncbi:hypothetical protein JCM12856_31390 [Spirochaeta dissipatitropha]